MLVLKFASPVACTYGKRYVTNLKHEVLFDCLPYEWRSGTSDGLFLPIYPPRSMRVVLGFWWLVDFCNKYVSSLWLMLSPWIIRTLTFPSLLASSVPCIALSHIESWCKLRRCIQTHDTIRSIIDKHHYIFPQNSHHTYLLRHFHSLSEIHCHATSIISWFDIHVMHAFAWS